MTGQETLIYIDENDKKEAGINAKHFAKDDVKNRAYYNTLGAQLIKKFLASENVDAANTYNIHSIKKILEEFDIADVMLGNIHIDVRIVFNENFIFVPKSHFKYEILPDIYLVLLMSNDKKYVKFLGFFEPKLINKNNENEEYYFIEKEKLTPPTNLKEYISKFAGNTDQELSESEINTSDMLIISMIDQDITEQEKKQLLNNLVKSAKLRDRFIEFENFETLSYRAESSTDIKKPEVSAIPSLDVAAAATAEALEQMDFGGSITNEQKIANENEIINGFNDLERNIPDLTPANTQSEKNQAEKPENLESFSELMDFENTGNDSPTTPTIDSAKVSAENSQNSDDLLEFGEFEDLTLDFNDLESDNTIDDSSNETTVSQTGIIEQQNSHDIVDFDEIMPVEANTTSPKTEINPAADETVDFNDIAPVADTTQAPIDSKQDPQLETVSFDEIPADNRVNQQPTETNTAEAAAPSQELADFDNLSTDNAPSLEANNNELTLGTDLADINNEFNTEPEMNLTEPLQDLSFDDETLSLDEPLLDISDEPAARESDKAVSASNNNLSELNDLENLLMEDEQAHNNAAADAEPVSDLQELPEISQEDMELDKMLASENILPVQNQAADDQKNLIDKNKSAQNSTESAAPQEATLQQTTSDFASVEDTITDLNLEADEIEKSISTDDIAGIGEMSELHNNTDLSTNDLISQIDDLLGTEETTTQTAQPAISETEDKLGMLFNTNENANAEDTDNADFADEDEPSSYPGQSLQQSSFAPEKGKKAVLAAAAIVAVLAIAGGAGLFLKSKNSSNLLAQNPIESDTANIPAPATEDNTDLMTNTPDTNAQTPEQATPKTPAQQKPANPAPQTKTAPKTTSKTTQQKPSGTPLPYITVRSVAWEVPDYLSYSDKVKKYLQTAGKSIRLTLSSDLLLTNEYAYSNQVKVELKLKNDGTIQDAQITKSSGSNQINDIVLRTVKDTLKVVKPAPGEIPTPDFKLGLIINL